MSRTGSARRARWTRTASAPLSSSSSRRRCCWAARWHTPASVPRARRARPANFATRRRDAPTPLTGRVSAGYRREGDLLVFRVRDRSGPATAVSVTVRYARAVPDPFPRRGAEIIVTVHRRGNAFVAEKDSLVTRCPSKVSDGQGRRLLVAGRACLLLALASASTAGAALCAPGVRAYRALGRPSACRAPSWGPALTEMGGSAHRGQGVQRRCSLDSGACDPAVRTTASSPGRGYGLAGAAELFQATRAGAGGGSCPPVFTRGQPGDGGFNAWRPPPQPTTLGV